MSQKTFEENLLMEIYELFEINEMILIAFVLLGLPLEIQPGDSNVYHPITVLRSLLKGVGHLSLIPNIEWL